jgi:hypothetical protein
MRSNASSVDRFRVTSCFRAARSAISASTASQTVAFLGTFFLWLGLVAGSRLLLGVVPIEFAPVAVALGAVTLHAVATIRNAPTETRRCYAIAIGTGLLSMLPTLVEQFWSRPGNLTLIAEALGADGPRPSLADALGITAAQLSAPVRDLLGLDEGLTTTMALAQLVAGAGAVLAAWRSESRALFGLACVALAVQASAPLAVLRIVGEIRPHMLQWIATAGAVGLWPVIAALGLGSRRSRAASLRLAAAVILGCTVVYAGATRLAAQTLVFIASVERDPGSAAGTPGLAILLDAIAAAVPEGPRDVQLRVLSADAPKPGYPDFTAGNGLVLGLKKRGFVVAPEPAHAFAYPRWMTCRARGRSTSSSSIRATRRGSSSQARRSRPATSAWWVSRSSARRRRSAAPEPRVSNRDVRYADTPVRRR